MSDTLTRLVEEFCKLPGVGRKTAQRLALHFLKADRADAASLASALLELKDRARPCRECNNITEADFCGICRDPKRDRSRILVVEEISDLLAIEATHEYRGLYHVLMGAISPIDGVGPDDTKVAGLVTRVGKGGIEEVILATNPNLKGEATALYITKLLRPQGVKLTRIAYGVPMGGVLEYSDSGTLIKSIEGRRPVE
jgi:recombination protein RecR